ncbi:telomere-protecting terminal protein Tpg [Streptomyces sp. NPDC058442]|uniref:telomere-protecting terminal protein Tpg n=1 Tax=Streptomyces sp. NPDC058442 TaxID=3346503 RepID=UPI003660AC40
MNTGRPARFRHLTLAPSPQHAARLLNAQDTGASEQQLRDIAAEGLGEVYFRDGGRRAHGLEVEFTDVEHVEFDL